jgi:predicted nucleic acid-binding protein
MSEKERLHHLIDELPDSEISAALRFLESLTVREAPVDPEMLARIDAARANPSPGIPHEEILREFGQ